MKFATVSLLIVVCLASAMAAAPHSKFGTLSLENHSKSMKFDYLLLVQAWPQTLCITAGKSRQCSIPSNVNFWTMHGLWPSNNDDSYPAFCTSDKFDESKVENIMDDMNKYWPNCFNDHDDSFWSHEWTKHGTCCGKLSDLSNEHDYFQTTLDTYHKLNVYSALANAGITPSSSKLYNMKDIVGAIKASVGVTPLMSCDSDNGQKFFNQVGFCLDNNTLEPFECDSRVYAKSSCQDDEDVAYPIIQH